MIGEMDFSDVFHSDPVADGKEVALFFPESTYAIYVCFLILIALIVMNLLVSRTH